MLPRESDVRSILSVHPIRADAGPYENPAVLFGVASV